MGDPILEFRSSAALSMGVELELQVLSTTDYNLTQGASYLLRQLKGVPGDIKHEITESMLEIATGVHTRHGPLLADLTGLRDALVRAADRLNLALCGGGAHPFQRWSERRIVENPRYKRVSELYGYLAKQFTVFGQHIHLGCPSPDDALYLLHALSRYIPHFIALASASPYSQGVDTRFATSRLHAVSAFPLSGHCPYMERWSEFEAYFQRMRDIGIVSSMKDFYWDVRPKPEFGTVEIRVCDTPLSVRHAADLAAYSQALASRLLREREPLGGPELYLPYTTNRFNACRFGLDAQIVQPFGKGRKPLRDDILETLQAVSEDGRALDCGAALGRIAACAASGVTPATWIRAKAAELRDLSLVVRAQAQLWRSDAPPLGT